MKYLLNTIVVLTLLLSVNTIHGQVFKNNIRQYRAQLEDKAGKLIDSGNGVSADILKTEVKPEGYEPLNLNLGKMKKRKLRPGKLYAKVSEATVIVSRTGRCGKSSERGGKCKRIHTSPASGYIIDAKGIIVTNYHVVASYISEGNTTSRDALVVMLKDGTTFPVQEILSADELNDLAIIKIDPKRTELPSLRVATKDAEIGDPAYVVSHPKGFFYAFSSGMVTDKFSQYNGEKHMNVMAISADYAVGSSGAAIIDECGNVIGTVCYTNTIAYPTDKTKTQMVVKGTIPASSLLKLIEEGN